MSINLENIDKDEFRANIEEIDKTSSVKEVTVLIGKDILLKISKQKSLFNINKGLRQLINFENLLLEDNVKSIEKMVLLNREINKRIEESIQRRDSFAPFLIKYRSNHRETGIIKEMIKRQKDFFGKTFNKILDLSKGLSEIQKKYSITISSIKHLYFCSTCKSFIDELREASMFYEKTRCPLCATEINEKHISNIPYLDKNIESYLNGKWLENYMAKLFESVGYKVWPGIFVAGVSGINHEIDLLAVKSGYTVILECKTSRRTDQNGRVVAKIKRKEDIFNLAIKNNDIKSNYAFLITLYELPKTDKESISFLKKTPGLGYLDNLINKTDAQVIRSIKKLIKS